MPSYSFKCVQCEAACESTFSIHEEVVAPVCGEHGPMRRDYKAETKYLDLFECRRSRNT